MSFTEQDYLNLNNSLKKTYKLSEVKDRIEKIAFDVVRFKDSDSEELWQIQQDSDGDYIVARYELEPEDTTTKTASKSPWDVLADAKTGRISVFYKDYPVAKFVAQSLGVSVSDFDALQRHLPKKLATDSKLVNSLLKTLSASERYQLCRQFPEISEQR